MHRFASLLAGLPRSRAPGGCICSSGCNKLKARDLLNKGVTAFKNGQSDAAIEDFKEAKEADPELLKRSAVSRHGYAALYSPARLPRKTWLAQSGGCGVQRSFG